MIIMTEGAKVTYIRNGCKDHGIIKSFPDSRPCHAYVVFNCADDWDNYLDYTAQHTPIKYLKPGWLC